MYLSKPLSRISLFLLFCLLCLGSNFCAQQNTDHLDKMCGDWYGKIQISPVDSDWTVAIFNTVVEKINDNEINFDATTKQVYGGDNIYKIKLNYDKKTQKHHLSMFLFNSTIFNNIPLTYSKEKGFTGEHQVESGKLKGTHRAIIKINEEGEYVFTISVIGNDEKHVIDYIIRLSKKDIPLFG